MPVDLSGRQIYLSAAAGSENALQIVRDVVSAFNERHAAVDGVVFLMAGPGGPGARRVELNAQIESADFFLQLLTGGLESPVAPVHPYRTRAAEELAVAAAARGNAASPMSDLAVLYAPPEQADLIAPSAGLAAVLSLRDAVEAAGELDPQPYASEPELRAKVEAQLRRWQRDAESRLPQQYPRLRAALDLTGVEAAGVPAPSTPAELVVWAEEKAAQGRNARADSAFAQAVLARDPDHLLRYARFLQGTGQLDRAFKHDEEALSTVVGSDDPVAVGHQIAALANMGLIKRRQGDLAGARRLLDEAVESAEGIVGVSPEQLSYALDQHGLTANRMGDTDEAVASFTMSAEIRAAAGVRTGQAQSLVHLARISRQTGRVDDAIEQLERALALLDGDDETRLLASVLAGLGGALVLLDSTRARTLLERSLSINNRFDIPDGVSIANAGLAEIELGAGRYGEAAGYAEAALDASSRSSNQEGAAVAHRLIGRICCAREQWDRAAESLETAVELAASQRDPGREALARLWLARARIGARDPEGARSEVTAGLAAAARTSDSRVRSELEVMAAEVGVQEAG